MGVFRQCGWHNRALEVGTNHDPILRPNYELQAKTFLEVIDEYGLSGKVGYFTINNHDANGTMLDSIAKEIEGLDLVAKRLHCSAHVMNIIV